MRMNIEVRKSALSVNNNVLTCIYVMLVLLFVFAGESRAQANRNLLSGNYSEQDLSRVVLPISEWHPFPTISDREEWSRIPENLRVSYVQNGEKYLGKPWNTITAGTFLEFVRNGNRSNYESQLFGRRQRLMSLVFAEIFENKGRFLDDIANGVWLICEETFWGVPAHMNHQKKGFGLPDVTDPVIDLFAAETGAMLSYVYYLLGDKLNEVSPLITERIIEEEERRIIKPFLEKDFSWKGTGVKKTVNNWNPWINSNVLAVVLFTEKDNPVRNRAIYNMMQSVDVFINGYPEDGGCDEGPSYWSHAAGSMFDFLELLYSATGGKINLYENPLIQKMGQYIYKVWIGGNYFVNFADANGRLYPEAELIYRYGKRISDPLMAGFGALLGKKQDIGNTIQIPIYGSLNNILPGLFSINEILDSQPVEPFIQDTWFPGRQVLTARSFPDSDEGLYVAAKAGNNAENHNHNDVGNFIVYCDGKPVLIDAGVVTYTAKTFSKDRYSIGTMQSQYHNLPTINGVMQKYGAEFKADKVKYECNANNVVFMCDIAGAYPTEAGVISWARKINFVRNNKIILSEEYKLQKFTEPVKLNFISPLWGDASVPGKVRLTERQGSPASEYIIAYDPEKYSAAIENITLDDQKLIAVWGNDLIRIVFTSKDTGLTGNNKMEISKINLKK